jgi:5-methylcytosine-specific restriction endonuclease McrA
VFNKPVLKLNADFRPLSLFPLSICSQEEAIRNLYEETAVLVSTYGKPLRSQNLTWEFPSVIALKKYVPTPRYIAFTRYNVYLRDHFRCQYCGEKKEVKNLTFDHVIPRSRGGQTNWENIVAACHSCNQKKGDEVKGWKPIRPPRKPTAGELLKAMKGLPNNHLHESFMDYIYWDYPLEED